MYKICYYVPETHLLETKEAMFNAGAGQCGKYKYCAFVTKGQGQFLPMEGSNPYIGDIEEIAFVDEYKVEMICDDSHIEGVIKALKESHPYEEPAYEAWSLAYSGA